MTPHDHPAPSAQLSAATVDLDRRRRCGYPEVIFGPGKTVEQICQIAAMLVEHGEPVLATRIDEPQAAGLLAAFPTGRHNKIARTFRFGGEPSSNPSLQRSRNSKPFVAVISAGTGDLPVAEEARETLDWMGVSVTMIHDVGVAGPQRLPARLADFEQAAAIVVVAGMEGALPSVVGGYVSCPVIGVPTSIGYGANFGGVSALLSMLNSCANNVAVVNIDAGFKAGFMAGLIANHSNNPSSVGDDAESAYWDPIKMNLEDLTNMPLPALRPREADSHKGDFGRALLIGGSRGMSGAISLAGQATLRSGAGLVTLAVPCCVLDVVASIEPSYMTTPLVDEDDHIARTAMETVVGLAQNATAVALGPGLGRCPNLTDLVVDLYREINKPMVVDADALFALAERKAALAKPAGPRILTPHPGEFARIAGSLPEGSQRITAAAELAQRDAEGNTIVVLKGHNTVVTDGTRFSINQTGNPGMATGGTGDVLTGIITALLCQGLEPFDAARLGVHVHGLAGDLAAEEFGQVSMIASDLIHYLPKAFRAVVG